MVPVCKLDLRTRAGEKPGTHLHPGVDSSALADIRPFHQLQSTRRGSEVGFRVLAVDSRFDRVAFVRGKLVLRELFRRQGTVRSQTLEDHELDEIQARTDDLGHSVFDPSLVRVMFVGRSTATYWIRALSSRK
jgi:hypothetical protein